MKLQRTKLILAGILFLTVLILSPQRAFAAADILVDGTDYTAAASGTGSGGGSWAWDGAGSLTLDGYRGGVIVSGGDLTIALTGDCAVTGDPDGIYSYGSITITGGGSLEVTAGPGSGVQMTAGIVSGGGDIRIEGTQVTVNSTITSAGNTDTFGIRAQDGDVRIIDSSVTVVNTNTAGGTAEEAAKSYETCSCIEAVNYGGGGGNISITGSTVNVTASGSADDATAIHAVSGDVSIDRSAVSARAETSDANQDISFAYAINAFCADDLSVCLGGHILITDSTVNASASDPNASSDAIYAADYRGVLSPAVIIAGSSVTASGEEAAIMSLGITADLPGTITIDGVLLPAGAQVSGAAIDCSGTKVYGQIVGSAADPVTWILDSEGRHNPAVLTGVTIGPAAAKVVSPVTGVSRQPVIPALLSLTAACAGMLFLRRKNRRALR